MLRHHLLELGRPQVVIVSSPQPGDGKTTVALNLALALAECGRAKVLLAETHVRRPQLASVFQLVPPWCFAEQLAAHRHQPMLPWWLVEIPQLWLHVAAINPRIDKTQLLDAPAFAIAMERLRTAGYEHIVIDAPPVLGSADVNLMADAADAVVLAVRARRSTTRDLRKAIDQIGAARSSAPCSSSSSTPASRAADASSSSSRRAASHAASSAGHAAAPSAASPSARGTSCGRRARAVASGSQRAASSSSARSSKPRRSAASRSVGWQLGRQREHAVEVAVVVAVVEADRIARRVERAAGQRRALRLWRSCQYSASHTYQTGMLPAPRDPAPRAHARRRGVEHHRARARRRAVVRPAREPSPVRCARERDVEIDQVAVLGARLVGDREQERRRPAARGAHRLGERADLRARLGRARLVDRDRERHAGRCPRSPRSTRAPPRRRVAGSSGITTGT